MTWSGRPPPPREPEDEDDYEAEVEEEEEEVEEENEGKDEEEEKAEEKPADGPFVEIPATKSPPYWIFDPPGPVPGPPPGPPPDGTGRRWARTEGDDKTTSDKKEDEPTPHELELLRRKVEEARLELEELQAKASEAQASQATQPKTTEPEATKQEATEPEATQSEANKTGPQAEATKTEPQAKAAKAANQPKAKTEAKAAAKAANEPKAANQPKAEAQPKKAKAVEVKACPPPKAKSSSQTSPEPEPDAGYLFLFSSVAADLHPATHIILLSCGCFKLQVSTTRRTRKIGERTTPVGGAGAGGGPNATANGSRSTGTCAMWERGIKKEHEHNQPCMQSQTRGSTFASIACGCCCCWAGAVLQVALCGAQFLVFRLTKFRRTEGLCQKPET
jgi:hypothetical protein